MSLFMCQYGNCNSFNTPIIVSDKKRMERARFCCAEHAALYLLRQSNKTIEDKLDDLLGRQTPEEYRKGFK
jgi:hypothetical protein